MLKHHPIQMVSHLCRVLFITRNIKMGSTILIGSLLGIFGSIAMSENGVKIGYVHMIV